MDTSPMFRLRDEVWLASILCLMGAWGATMLVRSMLS